MTCWYVLTLVISVLQCTEMSSVGIGNIICRYHELDIADIMKFGVLVSKNLKFPVVRNLDLYYTTL